MSTTNISPHRDYLNRRLLPYWAARFSAGQVVYDVGKSTMWNYADQFTCNLVTVDRNPDTKPDVVADLERTRLPEADGILFNGVFEQCNDPFALIRNLRAMLLPCGSLLAGLAGIGMAPYGAHDKWRLTQDGAFAYLSDFANVQLLYATPEYYFLEARL